MNKTRYRLPIDFATTFSEEQYEYRRILSLITQFTNKIKSDENLLFFAKELRKTNYKPKSIEYIQNFVLVNFGVSIDYKEAIAIALLEASIFAAEEDENCGVKVL